MEEWPAFLLIIWDWTPSLIISEILVWRNAWNLIFLRPYFLRIFSKILDGVSGWIGPPNSVVKTYFEFSHLVPNLNFCFSCSILYFFNIFIVVGEIYIFLSLFRDLVSFSIIPLPFTYCVVLFIVKAPDLKQISFQVIEVNSPSSATCI